MQSVQKSTWQKNRYFNLTKSFLLWSFTLTVCLLVIGFPVGVLLVTVGILATVVLQTMLPSSAVLLVAGSIMALNVLTVVLGAMVLTAKGIHPQEVSWLNWLHSQETAFKAPIYASCPLTCELG
ncbi:MAG TPA: hypothetical protein ACFCUY_03435 [Xenococcaceae cyanobacterium]